MRIGKVRRAIGVDEALRHHWCEAGVVMAVSRVAHSGRQGLTVFPITASTLRRFHGTLSTVTRAGTAVVSPKSFAAVRLPARARQSSVRNNTHI